MSASGKARCPGCDGKSGLAELCAGTVSVWADYEGVTWSRNAKGAAYWHYCLDCHNKRWCDGRKRGRWSNSGFLSVLVCSVFVGVWGVIQ
jgi:hypothetical protein